MITQVNTVLLLDISRFEHVRPYVTGIKCFPVLGKTINYKISGEGMFLTLNLFVKLCC